MNSILKIPLCKLIVVSMHLILSATTVIGLNNRSPASYNEILSRLKYPESLSFDLSHNVKQYFYYYDSTQLDLDTGGVQLWPTIFLKRGKMNKIGYISTVKF